VQCNIRSCLCVCFCVMVVHQSLERLAETRTRPMLRTIRRHFASSHRLGGRCHALAALSCYRLSHSDSTFAIWTAEQHLHDRCGLRDRTYAGPRRVSGLSGSVRGKRWPASQPWRSQGHQYCSVSSGRKASVSVDVVDVRSTWQARCWR